MMKTNKLKVVLDTNVLLVSIPPGSKYRLIFDKLLMGVYDLFISNEILSEYEEKIAQWYDEQTVKELFEIFLVLPNVHRAVPYFRWNLIVADPDDNKFADLAIAANADFLVTNDKHFNVLKTIDFPKLTVCKAEDFKTIIEAASRDL